MFPVMTLGVAVPEEDELLFEVVLAIFGAMEILQGFRWRR